MSARWRAVRARSVALSRRDSSSSTRSPSARRAGLEGRVSTASHTIAAWAADTSPERSAARVAVRSVTSACAFATARRPSRRVTPATWVNQSEVEPQCSRFFARSLVSASASSCASTAATWAFSAWNSRIPSTSSSSEAPAHSRSSRTASSRLAASNTAKQPSTGGTCDMESTFNRRVPGPMSPNDRRWLLESAASGADIYSNICSNQCQAQVRSPDNVEPWSTATHCEKALHRWRPTSAFARSPASRSAPRSSHSRRWPAPGGAVT